MWKEWINALLGLFVVVLGFSQSISPWIVIAGLVVLILSVWELLDRALPESGGSEAHAR